MGLAVVQTRETDLLRAGLDWTESKRKFERRDAYQRELERFKCN